METSRAVKVYWRFINRYMRMAASHTTERAIRYEMMREMHL